MSSRRTHLLAISLQRALATIGKRLGQERRIEPALAAHLLELHHLAPEMAIKADREIAETARLHSWRPVKLSFFTRLEELFVSRLTSLTQLKEVEGLEYLFLFHRDGYLREAALRKISGPLPSAFAFAAVSWRLNDWVQPVRAAAVDCAKRSFPLTPAPIVASAALALLPRKNTWARWRDEKSPIESVFDRADVSAALADAIIQQVTGPTAKALRCALENDALDPYLVAISLRARQPQVRALAFQTMINGHATWPNGWQWRWVDKSMGVRKREPVLAQRNLTTAADKDAIISACASDKSAMVRKLALADVIRFSLRSAQAQILAEALANDSSPAVRERAEFILRNQAQPKS